MPPQGHYLSDRAWEVRPESLCLGQSAHHGPYSLGLRLRANLLERLQCSRPHLLRGRGFTALGVGNAGLEEQLRLEQRVGGIGAYLERAANRLQGLSRATTQSQRDAEELEGGRPS